MNASPTRRHFLAAAAATVVGTAAARTPSAGDVPPKRVIAGKPRDRGRTYGKLFKDGIAAFLDREIYAAFAGKPAPKDDMLRYAAACGKAMRSACPVVHDELEGVAEGSGQSFDAVVLLTLHEELFHRGWLPKVPHCTAVAAGPPITTGATLVGQTWDWMESVYGLSSVVEWRAEKSSVLAYGFPGLWAGAGLSSGGFALCWTSADLGNKALGCRVGVPSYALIAHLLYQESLADALAEAARDTHAGWFAFVLGGKDGTLAAVEGSPKGVHVHKTKGHLERVGFASREMVGKDAPLHPRCTKMAEMWMAAAGKADLGTMKRAFADPACGISVGKPTIDMMAFDCTNLTAHLSRGPSYKTQWKTFTFGDAVR